MRLQRWWDILRMRGRSLTRRASVERELDKELRFHVEQETEANMESGMPLEEARRAALLKIGGVAQVQEECRDMRRTSYVENFGRDLRYAARILRRSPGFAAVVALTLALGIGANTAIFSVVYAVMFRPLPYADPGRLVAIWETRSDIDPSRFPDPKGAAAMFQRWPPSNRVFARWKTQNRSFERIAGFGSWTATLTGGGAPERPQGLTVTPDFFPLFGARPMLGRTFLPDEDQAGNDEVVVLGHGLWQRRFGSDRNVLGKKVLIDGAPHTVIGVMPANFEAVLPDVRVRRPEYFLPTWHETTMNRGFAIYQVAGRLKPAVSLAQAQAEMSALAASLEREFPRQHKGHGVRLVPLAREISGEARPSLLVLLAAVGCVLLICCANVANLMLARASIRRHEIGVRAVLGAGRWRLIRQMLTESLMLAALGGVAGLLLARWGVQALVAAIPQGMVPRLEDVRVDSAVLVFGIGLSLFTGVLFGLFPAFEAGRSSLHGFQAALNERGAARGKTGRGPGLRGVLVVSEIAIALVLLTGAGLLIRSFIRLRGVDLGFHPENVLTLAMKVTDPRFSDKQRRGEFSERVVERVRALPSVQAAAATSSVPIAPDMTFSISGIELESRPGVDISSLYRAITPEYFRVMGISLRKGREFTGDDARGGVVIVNQAFVRHYLPSVRDDSPEPLGRHFQWGKLSASIVGVVSDVKCEGVASDAPPEVFVPHTESFGDGLALVVRTGSDPQRLAPLLSAAVHEINPDQALNPVVSMEQIVSDSVAQPRFYMLLLSAFAGLSLVLAGVGVYGVIAYSVTQRTHEIGIRMALGAKRSRVLRMIVGQAVGLAVAGVGIGLAAAAAATRVLARFLFGVKPIDALTFGAMAAALIAVAVGASLVPACRATRVDPMIALRWE